MQPENTKAFFFSALFTGKELCVSLFVWNEAPFYYKIHRAALNTGLVEMWYSPSLSGHPTIRDVCRLLSPYCLDCGCAFPPRQDSLKEPRAMVGLDLRLSPVQLWLLCGALLEKLTTSRQINKGGIREDSCSSCSKSSYSIKHSLKCPARRPTMFCLPQHSEGSPDCGLRKKRKKECFPKPQSCMQTLSCDLRKRFMLPQLSKLTHGAIS